MNDNRSSIQILIEDLFAIDTRSLAMLRISLAAIVLVFVFSQFGNVDLLYTDRGILPRDLNQQYLDSGWYWSLYWINGSFSFAQTLLVLTAIAAGIMMLGFQTRLATFACLVLVWSIQVRNPLTLTAGDILLRMLLFWSSFLPLGAIWSIDAARSGGSGPDRWSVVSIATLAIMLQMAYMYFFSGIAKWNEYWLSGLAMEYSMHLEMYVKPPGRWLAGFPGLLQALTFFILLVEIVGPFFLFVPKFTSFSRGVLMAVFWLMHLAIWLTMSIGLFSITAICAWVIFVPGDQWNAMFGEPVGFHDVIKRPQNRQRLFWAGNMVCGLFLVYVTLQNVAYSSPWLSGKFQVLEKFGSATMTIQKFHMFGHPPVYSPWFEYAATLNGGENVDLFDFRHTNLGSPPGSIYGYMRSQTWRRIHWNLISIPDKTESSTEQVNNRIRSRLLNHRVRRWDQNHLDNPVEKAVLDCHLVPIELDSATDESRHLEPIRLRWATYDRENGNHPGSGRR